jgi:MFS family permease
MSFVGDLRHLLREQQFRRLFSVRVTSQAADGVFQVALASYVLFSPERHADAQSIAAAFAAVLLPFSVLGPFAGVFLDRWNRRQVLALVNAARVVPVLATAVIVTSHGSDLVLFVVVIAAFSMNRFLLAGLSAALPHVVLREELVLANAVTPTAGTIAFLVGVAVGTGLRRITFPGSDDVVVTVVIICFAAVGYLAAAGLALRIPRDRLGPDYDPDLPAVRRELRRVASGLVAGLRHLRERRPAAHALTVIAAHRFWYGLSVVATVLLYRNYFNAPSDTDAGLAGLSEAVLVSGAGFLTAAVVTPIALQRTSIRSWVITLLLLAAVVQAFPGALYTEPGLLVAAYGLGLSAQGVKICVDTLVQVHIDDAFRGRVFSLYDVIFNVVFVAAAAVGAVVLPEDGKSYAVLATIVVGYLLTAAWYARVTPARQTAARPTRPAAPP